MAFVNLCLLSDAIHADALCDALLSSGALSASIEDADAGTPAEKPQFGEPDMAHSPLWERARVTALFSEDIDAETALLAALLETGIHPAPLWHIEILPEQNWVELTQSQFGPLQISPKLWIVPSWHEAPDPDAINIMLDPGMAFGTGSHPTTKLCLRFLSENVVHEMTMLDYGCGSGILAIAAAKLGASLVEGVDIDKNALFVATENAKRNNITAQFIDTLAVQGKSYDIVVANILSNPLKLLAPALSAHVREKGFLVLSGILETQAEELISLYAPWLSLQVFALEESWCCLAGRKEK